MTTDDNALILLLLGASSTGKTAVGTALHGRLPRPSVFIPGDALKLPEGSPAQNAIRAMSREAQFEFILATDRAYYGALESYRQQGIHAIGEVGIFNQPRRELLMEELQRLPIRLIRLTSAEQARVEREAARGDRWVGISAYTAENEETDMPFDLVIDTTAITAEEAADVIIEHIARIATRTTNGVPF